MGRCAVKLNGNDYRLFVESATPGTYAELKGQGDMELNETSSTTDTTTKDEFPYGSSMAGARSLTLSVNVVPNLPDAGGYTRLETIAKAAVSTSVKLQIRKGGSAGVSPGDVVHECVWNITGRPRSFGQGGAVTGSFTFANAAAPTVDALA
jgi:hypothetical protein